MSSLLRGFWRVGHQYRVCQCRVCCSGFGGVLGLGMQKGCERPVWLLAALVVVDVLGSWCAAVFVDDDGSCEVVVE